MAKIGVDTFIWAEDFDEKDLWIIPKAKELGFSYIDFAVAHPERFPTEQVAELVRKADIVPITTSTVPSARPCLSRWRQWCRQW